jgi:hypothetical protein
MEVGDVQNARKNPTSELLACSAAADCAFAAQGQAFQRYPFQ